MNENKLDSIMNGSTLHNYIQSTCQCCSK